MYVCGGRDHPAVSYLLAMTMKDPHTSDEPYTHKGSTHWPASEVLARSAPTHNYWKGSAAGRGEKGVLAKVQDEGERE